MPAKGGTFSPEALAKVTASNRRRAREIAEYRKQHMVEIFWSKVRCLDEKSCWPWVGGTYTYQGRGYITIAGIRWFSHRLAWMIAHNRKISKGRMIRHKCDNPNCVNPTHLLMGTAKDNVHDAIKRGRAFTVISPNGERHWNARLNEKEVTQIIHAHTIGGITQAELARRYKVSYQIIHRIVRKRSWKHI